MLVSNFNRHIHQIWFQKSSSINKPGVIDNQDYLNCKKMYTDFCTRKNWEYTLWDEKLVDGLIREHFPGSLEKFNSLDSIIKKVDCARYMILYVHGGLYVDIDSYPKRDLDEFLNLDFLVRDNYPFTAWHIAPKYKITNEYNLIVGQEKTIYEFYYNKFGIVVPKLNNAVIFASPKLKIFLDLIEIGFKRSQSSILNSFGVHTFSLTLYQEMSKFVNSMLDANDYSPASNILTLPSVYFYEPDVDRDDFEHWGGDPKHKNSPLQYIVHKYAGDWDEDSYGHFLTHELRGEVLDGNIKLQNKS